jgi:hypothetical protein
MLRLRDLREGAKVEQNGEVMTLISRSPSRWGDDIPYVVDELEEYSDDYEPASINHSKQRWLVQMEDGFRTHRYIEYLHSKGHLRVKNEDDDD